MKDLQELCEQYSIWMSVDGWDGYQFAVGEGEHGEVSLHIACGGTTVDHVTLGVERLESILFGFYLGFTQCVKHWEYLKEHKEKQNGDND